MPLILRTTVKTVPGSYPYTCVEGAVRRACRRAQSKVAFEKPYVTVSQLIVMTVLSNLEI
jgi:hypothetical protein